MVGQVPADYYAPKFSQSDIGVALATERERIVANLERWKTQYMAPCPGPIDLNALCRSVVESAVNMVRG